MNFVRWLRTLFFALLLYLHKQNKEHKGKHKQQHIYNLNFSLVHSIHTETYSGNNDESEIKLKINTRPANYF